VRRRMTRSDGTRALLSAPQRSHAFRLTKTYMEAGHPGGMTESARFRTSMQVPQWTGPAHEKAILRHRIHKFSHRGQPEMYSGQRKSDREAE
jgi:hypothetical protein